MVKLRLKSSRIVFLEKFPENSVNSEIELKIDYISFFQNILNIKTNSFPYFV